MARRRRSSEPPPPDAPQLDLPVPDDGIGSASFWNAEIEDATRRMQDAVGEWKGNLARYEGAKPKLRGFRNDDSVSVNVGFYTVEQKKPQLFFQTPQVTAKALRPDAQAVTPLVQAIINRRLQPDDINAPDLVNAALDDCLITAGIGGSKIGYDEVSVDKIVPTGRTIETLDPLTQQPVRVLALDPETGEPETTAVKSVLWSSIYWRHIAPTDLRFPLGFVGVDFDAAPWLGWRFNVDENFARKYGLNVGVGQPIPDDMTLLNDRDREKLMSIGSGYEIWYRAALYDPTERNPDRIRRLVLIASSRRAGHGDHAVVCHENSPYQVFDEDGRFVQGMHGYPIHPLCIRPLAERVYPKSDCGVLRDVADEKSLGRTLMVQQRRRNLPLRGFNKNSADAEAIRKIENAEVQELIAFTGDPREQLFQLPQANLPPENMSIDAIVQQDIDRLSASGSNQQGLTSNANSATESALIQKALETRLAKERNRVLLWFTSGVTKLFALIQLYASDEDVALVVGEDGAEQFRTWKRQEIQGRFAFALKPDSALRIDAEDERNHFLRLFNLAANHPNANGEELLRMLAQAWGLDPTRIIRPPAPPPPPPPPEKPRISIALKGDDLNPFAGQYQNVLTLLQLAGIGPEQMSPPGPPPGPPGARPGPPGPPQGPQQAQPPGGPPNGPPRAPERPARAVGGIPPIDKHDADLTGNMRGPGPRIPSGGMPQ